MKHFWGVALWLNAWQAGRYLEGWKSRIDNKREIRGIYGISVAPPWHRGLKNYLEKKKHAGGFMQWSDCVSQRSKGMGTWGKWYRKFSLKPTRAAMAQGFLFLLLSSVMSPSHLSASVSSLALEAVGKTLGRCTSIFSLSSNWPSLTVHRKQTQSSKFWNLNLCKWTCIVWNQLLHYIG